MFKDIINSGYKATIVECGHGCEIANTVLSLPKASKFLVLGFQPYSKEAQVARYYRNPNKMPRSVSKEFVDRAASVELVHLNDYVGGKENLLAIVTSFQLGGPKAITHGYMCIAKRKDGVFSSTIYHFSLPKATTDIIDKAAWLSYIKCELLNVIDHDVNEVALKTDFLDSVWTSTSDSSHLGFKYEHNVERTLQAATSPNQIYPEYPELFLCFSHDPNIVRLEDVLRLNKTQERGIVIQKGSFNPIHRMHRKMAENAITGFPDYPHVLMLSLNTCDKGSLELTEIAQRVNALVELGYTVVVVRNGKFADNNNALKYQYGRDLKVVFVVGEDTVERFFRDWDAQPMPKSTLVDAYKFSFANVLWYVTERKIYGVKYDELIPRYAMVHDNFKFSELDVDDISSTKIRAGEIQNET